MQRLQYAAKPKKKQRHALVSLACGYATEAPMRLHQSHVILGVPTTHTGDGMKRTSKVVASKERGAALVKEDALEHAAGLQHSLHTGLHSPNGAECARDGAQQLKGVGGHAETQS